VALWEVVFDIEDIAEIQGAGGTPARRVTRFTDMRYFVGPFPDLMVTASPIWGSFHQTISAGDKVEMESKSTSRPRLPPSEDLSRRELLVGRNSTLCDNAISVETEGARRYSWPQPDRWVVSNNLIWPTSVTNYYSDGRLIASVDVDSAQPLATLTEQQVPYDYRQLVNQGRTTLPPFRAPVTFRQISRTINYSIVRQQTMKLEYLPQCRPERSRPIHDPPECVPDQVGNPALTCLTCDRVDDYYAHFGRNHFFIHANVGIRAIIGNEDVTEYMDRRSGQIKYFPIVRLRRAWESGLNSAGESDGNYTTNGWVEDHTGVPGSGNVVKPNWYDAPGRGQSLQPPRWPPNRLLQEFLVGVKDFPEFGFLYFTTISDTKPGMYRVRKSQVRRITEQDWCSIKQTPRPQWNGQGALDDSGWRQAPPITP
jgi:hypothetical protein